MGNKKGSRPVNLNLRIDIMERVEKFRFKQMFETKTEAIEFLLEHALNANLKRPAVPKSGPEK